jgi:hypothetical protein
MLAMTVGHLHRKVWFKEKFGGIIWGGSTWFLLTYIFRILIIDSYLQAITASVIAFSRSKTLRSKEWVLSLRHRLLGGRDPSGGCLSVFDLPYLSLQGTLLEVEMVFIIFFPSLHRTRRGMVRRPLRAGVVAGFLVMGSERGVGFPLAVRVRCARLSPIPAE